MPQTLKIAFFNLTLCVYSRRRSLSLKAYTYISHNVISSFVFVRFVTFLAAVAHFAAINSESRYSGHVVSYVGRDVIRRRRWSHAWWVNTILSYLFVKQETYSALYKIVQPSFSLCKITLCRIHGVTITLFFVLICLIYNTVLYLDLSHPRFILSLQRLQGVILCSSNGCSSLTMLKFCLRLYDCKCACAVKLGERYNESEVAKRYKGFKTDKRVFRIQFHSE